MILRSIVKTLNVIQAVLEVILVTITFCLFFSFLKKYETPSNVSRVHSEEVRPSSGPPHPPCGPPHPPCGPPVFRTPQVCTSSMVWTRVDISCHSEPVQKCWAISTFGHQGPTNPARTLRAWRRSRVDGAVMVRRRHAAATTFVGERSESHRKVPTEGMEEERRQWWD